MTAEIISLIIVIVVNLVGVAWMLRDALAKEREKTDLKIKASETEMKADFVCKNVCKVLHEVDERDKNRLEKKIDSILEKLDRWDKKE